MKGYHKKYKLHCKTLSPVHIGSGEVLSRWEYYIYQNNFYRVLDFTWTLLNSANDKLIDKVVKKINENNQGHSFKKFFDSLEEDIDISLIHEKYLDKCFSRIPIKTTLTTEKISDINLFSGSPNYIIPGSSIKGALRTGITVNDLEKCLDSSRNKNEIFNKIKFNERKAFEVNSRDSKNFQSVQISDVVLQSNNLSIRELKYLKGDTFILAELLDEDFEFDIEITHTEYKNKLYKNEIDPTYKAYDFRNDILQKASSFYKKVWDHLLQNDNYVQEFYKNNNSMITNEGSYLLRLGFGAGQLSNSILLPWQEKIKDDKLLRNGKARGKSGLYPSTIKRTANGMPLGWVLITKVEEC